GVWVPASAGTTSMSERKHLDEAQSLLHPSNPHPKCKRSATATDAMTDRGVRTLPPERIGVLSRRLGRGRHRGDRLEDLRSDLVGVALRVRAAVFQIPLVPVVDEAVGHSDRGTAVGDAIAEGVDRCGLVLAG